MKSATNHRALTHAFAGLANKLVGDFDVADLLHDLVTDVTKLIGVDAAGLLLSDHHGSLQLLASSTEATRLLELFQLQSDEGPCLECFHTGAAVSVPDLDSAAQRWPRFVPAASEAGYRAVHALPMRVRGEVIGALNLFSSQAGELQGTELELAQGLADVATIGILQGRAIQRREVLVEQTQAALNSRVLVEQAKGLIASEGLGMEDAFRSIRLYAAAHDARVAQVAENLVTGVISTDQVTKFHEPTPS